MEGLDPESLHLSSALDHARYIVSASIQTAGERERLQHDHPGDVLVRARIFHRPDHVNWRAIKDFHIDIGVLPDDGVERRRQVGSNVVDSASFNLEPSEKRDRNAAVRFDRVLAAEMHALIEGAQRALRLSSVAAARTAAPHVNGLEKSNLEVVADREWQLGRQGRSGWRAIHRAPRWQGCLSLGHVDSP